MITKLDQYVGGRVLVATLLVLLAAVGVVIGLHLMMSINELAKASLPPETNRFIWIARLYLLTLPEMVGHLLPWALVIGSLASCGAMLKRREFIALGASGIGNRRATLPIMFLAILVGFIDLALVDQVMPPLEDDRAEIEDLLTGSSRQGRIWTDADTGTAWYADRVKLVAGKVPLVEDVVVAPANDGLLHARALAWNGTAWSLRGPVLRLRDDGAQQPRPEVSSVVPCTGPLSLNLDPDGLTRILVNRHALGCLELMARPESSFHALAIGRLLRLFIPALLLAAALPQFVRHAQSDHLPTAALKAIGSALVPQCIVLLTVFSFDGLDASPWVIALVGLGLASIMPFSIWLRWR